MPIVTRNSVSRHSLMALSWSSPTVISAPRITLVRPTCWLQNKAAGRCDQDSRKAVLPRQIPRVCPPIPLPSAASAIMYRCGCRNAFRDLIGSKNRIADHNRRQETVRGCRIGRSGEIRGLANADVVESVDTTDLSHEIECPGGNAGSRTAQIRGKLRAWNDHSYTANANPEPSRPAGWKV